MSAKRWVTARNDAAFGIALREASPPAAKACLSISTPSVRGGATCQVRVTNNVMSEAFREGELFISRVRGWPAGRIFFFYYQYPKGILPVHSLYGNQQMAKASCYTRQTKV